MATPVQQVALSFTTAYLMHMHVLLDRCAMCCVLINVQWFIQIDKDRSGELDASELKEALALGNLSFSLTDVDSMIRCAEEGAC